MRYSVLLIICLTYGGLAQAQSIHRCEDERGKVSYSDTRCTAGTSEVKTLELEPPPSATASENEPDYKEEERAFQERRAERLKREQEEEAAAARQREQEEALAKAQEEQVEERYGTTYPYRRRLPNPPGTRPIRPSRPAPHQ